MPKLKGGSRAEHEVAPNASQIVSSRRPRNDLPIEEVRFAADSAPPRRGALVEGRCVRVGQNRQPPGAAPPRLSDRMRKQRTADAAANMARFDEQLVQVQRTGRIAGRERNDAGNLPVGPGRDPHIAGSDVLSGDPEGGKHQCHEFGAIAPYRAPLSTRAAPSA